MKILQIGMGNVAGGLEAFVMNYYRVLAVLACSLSKAFSESAVLARAFSSMI